MRYFLICLVGLALVLAGCGGGVESPPAPAEEVVPSEEITTTEEIAPAEEVTTTEEVPPAEEITTTEEMTPAEEITTTEEVAPSEEMTPTVEPSEEMTETVGINTVEVELVNGEIHMPESIPAGTTVFEVTNAGDTEHNFEIEGVTEGFDPDLQPGETQSVEVDLAAGEYIVYCPVDDHRAEGMELTLTVTEP